MERPDHRKDEKGYQLTDLPRGVGGNDTAPRLFFKYLLGLLISPTIIHVIFHDRLNCYPSDPNQSQKYLFQIS